MKVKFKIMLALGILLLMLTASFSKSSYTVTTGQTISYTVSKSTLSASKNNESYSYSGFQLEDIHFETGTEFKVNITSAFTSGIAFDIICEEVVDIHHTLSDNCELNLLNSINSGNRIAGELFNNWEYLQKYYERGLLLDFYPVILSEDAIMVTLTKLRVRYPILYSANFLNGSPVVNALIGEKKGKISGEWSISVDYYFQNEFFFHMEMSEKTIYEESTGILVGLWRKGEARRNIENDTYSVDYEFKVEKVGYELDGFEIGIFASENASGLIYCEALVCLLSISFITKSKRRKIKIK